MSTPLSMIPILVIFALVCYPVEMAYLAETSLGKLFCVMLIVYYGVEDPIYGAFVCAMVILYYQIGYLDHVLSVNRNILIQESMATLNSELATDLQASDVTLQKYNQFQSFTTRDASIFAYESSAPILTNDEKVLLDKDPKSELKAEFRKLNCRQGKMGVNNELAEHVVFPLSGNRVSTIRFNNDFAKCNPCDPHCGFSIVEEKLVVEDALSSPVESKNTSLSNSFDWVNTIDFRPFDSMMDDFRTFKTSVMDLYTEYIK
jgi:hypothetical protein